MTFWIGYVRSRMKYLRLMPIYSPKESFLNPLKYPTFDPHFFSRFQSKLISLRIFFYLVSEPIFMLNVTELNKRRKEGSGGGGPFSNVVWWYRFPNSFQRKQIYLRENDSNYFPLSLLLKIFSQPFSNNF